MSAGGPMRILTRFYCAALLVAMIFWVTACGGDTPSRLGGCDRLAGPALAEAVPSAEPVETGQDMDTVNCSWRSRGGGKTPTAVTVRVYQPNSYEDGQTRADEALASQWEKDDVRNVTIAVPGLGASGYRFTALLDDVVTVTVRGYLGFRELTVALSERYPSGGDVAAIEARAVAFAKSAMAAS